ncbi:protoheme IX farnesyltransferase, mitochondrial-like [Malus domestica]|uniref:protoheme IX farnesyltransferase, mitochondrial-like n=1 Tax=Malus domestica TaxID=3750 RepID=UPI003975C6A8
MGPFQVDDLEPPHAEMVFFASPSDWYSTPVAKACTTRSTIIVDRFVFDLTDIFVCYITSHDIYQELNFPACWLVISLLGSFSWAAASGQVSLNAMLLPAALYFWQIPHFMALAYLCRNDYAAGGFRMFSLADASGQRTASVALRNCIYMIPLGFLAYDWGMTSGWFCLESTLLTLAIAATSFSFYRDRTTHKARKMFHASLLYLPVFMSGIMFHRIVDNQQSLSEENLESSVELSLSSQDGNVKRKSRLRNTSDGSQVRPPVSYASIAPFPFLPVPSYADPRYVSGSLVLYNETSKAAQ